MKKWYLSKSIWLGVIMLAAAIAEYIAGLPPGMATAQAVSGGLTIVVRFLTNTGIGDPPTNTSGTT